MYQSARTRYQNLRAGGRIPHAFVNWLFAPGCRPGSFCLRTLRTYVAIRKFKAPYGGLDGRCCNDRPL